MANDDPRNFDTLSGLPDGWVNYLAVIERVLHDLKSREHPKVIDAERALAGDLEIALRSMESYLQNLQRMGLFVRQGDALTLMPLAQRFLEATGREEQARLLVEYLLCHCKGMAQVLNLYAQATRPLTLADIQVALGATFPSWHDAKSYKIRSMWLAALACIKKTGTGHNEITNFGRWCLAHYAPQTDEEVPVLPSAEDTGELTPTQLIDQSEDLVDELQSAAVDGGASERLELAVVGCLQFLTFDTLHLAQPGQSVPDILGIAALPEEHAYRVIFDTKARTSGRLEDLNVTTVLDYMEQQHAEYAVVVAANFADGKLSRQAEKHGIVLLTIGALCDWVRLHAKTPLTLADYEVIFQTGGLVEALPEAVQALADQQPRWGELMALLLYYLQDAQRKQVGSLTVQQIEVLLFARLDEKRFNETEIQRLLDFLGNPLVGCLLQGVEGKVSLRMNEATLMRRLRALSDHFADRFNQLRKGTSPN